MFVTVWAFMTILFVMFRVLPGDPVSLFVTGGMTEEQYEAALARLGVDQPLHVQYIMYFSNFLQGDLGRSYLYQVPVSEILVVKFWNTIFLMLGAYIIAIIMGVVLGSLLAWFRGTKLEKIGVLFPFLMRSTPEFWLGIILIIIFSFQLGWFPPSGMRSVGADVPTFWSRYLSLDFLHHMALPMLTGALIFSATPMLVMRNSMLEILNEDFINLKKAEGLPKTNLIYKHAARNSLLPVTTVAAIQIGMAVGGSVLIEVVFNWPGMGRAMIDAVNANDYPLAQGAFFLLGVTLITMNFVADILYAYLDPRVRYDNS